MSSSTTLPVPAKIYKLCFRVHGFWVQGLGMSVHRYRLETQKQKRHNYA